MWRARGRELRKIASQVRWSIAFAVLAAVLGYVFAGYGPIWLGFQSAVSAAGMIATVSGLILALACLFGPYRSRTGADQTTLPVS